MPANKRDRIEGLQDEEQDLHPLLDKLLRKLPYVVNVEHTHGPSEMGADFVISRRDPALDSLHYIGVIAKIGRIAQDFTEIERQIDECALPRPFLGGKEKVYVDEVWVVVNQNITKGAKEKINAKYANRKIEFIDSSRLITLIDTHLPVFWTDVSLEAGEYLTAVSAVNDQTDRAFSLVMVADRTFYVEQDIYEFPRLQYRLEMSRKQKRAKRVALKEIVSDKHLVVIEGAMGSGKSKLLRHMVRELSNPEVFLEAKLLPIPTTYGELEDSFAGSLQALIKERVPSLLREGEPNITFLVLIDALDEKNIPPEQQVAALGRLAEALKASPNTQAIVTSRYLRGLDETYELQAEISRYHLPPLTLAKTVQFIREVCTALNLSTRLLEDLRKSQLFKELPHSPISAILLAKLLNENPKELPSNMTELYSQYCELVLGRWDIDKGLQTQKEYQALDQILMRMAKQVLDFEMDYVTPEDLKGLVAAYLSERNLDIQPEALFERLATRCELLAADPAKKRVTFAHRTFAEFFYARDMRRAGTFDPVGRAFNLYWVNTVFFYIGILKDCPEILSQIKDLKPEDESERWIKAINMANYYLAGYASPYTDVVNGLTETFIDAAQLFRDIASGAIESPFAALPQMQLLWLMQLVLREGYSYSFFKAAIEDAALRIDEATLPLELKTTALFFLNVTYIDIGPRDALDFLLKRYSAQLPVDIALAVGHEGDSLEFRSALMKRKDRQIRSLIKASPRLKAQIAGLYERPLKETKLLLPPARPPTP